jgi:general secretion pathway protein G
MRNDMRNLIRVILVAFIILLFMSIMLPRGGGPGSARVAAAKADIACFEAAINRFRADCGYYPTTTGIKVRALNSPTRADGSNMLTKRPATIPQGVWRGPYLDSRSSWNDPWGRPYVFECPGKHNTNGFDVYSLGPNGKGGDEAIGNWTAP